MRYFEVNRDLWVLQDSGEIDVYTTLSSLFKEDFVKFTVPSGLAIEWLDVLKQEESETGNSYEISKEVFELSIEEDYIPLEDDSIIHLDYNELSIELLYHGTDAKIVRMTAEERISYKSCCKDAINYLYPLIEEKYYRPGWNQFCVDEGVLDTETKHYIDHMVLDSCRSSIKGSPLFQYPDNVLYFSTDHHLASQYARDGFAGGELGMKAFFMCKAAIEINFPDYNPDKKTAIAIQRVLEFGEQKREPVIFTLKNPNLLYLRQEGGGFGFRDGRYGRFRYIGPIELDLSTAEFLKV